MMGTISQAMINRSKNGPNDEIWTPEEALLPLLPHLPKPWVYWECAPGVGKLANLLRVHGLRVVADDRDFFQWEPAIWQCIVTNPPYSKKIQFLRRAWELQQPYAMLLPITALGARGVQKYLDHPEIIFLPRRIDFTGKKAPWFAVAWFTFGLNIGQQIIFSDGGGK